MKEGRTAVNNPSEIPEDVLCTFGRKVPRGIHYFVGYRKEDKIHVHFSMKKFELNNIISYQYVLSTWNRIIKK